jgi:hypothetical protein
MRYTNATTISRTLPVVQFSLTVSRNYKMKRNSALAHPGAVVIELVYAVRASRRAIDLADPAKPEPHFDRHQ